jgi:uroporphyrinogen III methyltransferase/synthase
MARIGRVYLTGAGPGDPELLTLKAKALLQKADTVVYDYLVGRRIIDLIPSRIKKVCFAQNGRKDYRLQNKINKFLTQEAKSGRQVVRLKNGDPFLFSRGSEEAQALAENQIPYEVIPGITAGMAACEYAGIPITQRHINSCVSFITASEAQDKHKSNICWKALVDSGATLIFYMVVGKLKDVCSKLRRYGLSRDTACYIIQEATTPRQKVLAGTLADIYRKARKARIKPPAILVVPALPLAGKRIVVTRPKGGELSALLTKQGAQVINFPTIKIKPNSKKIKNLSGFDWLVFTSSNAARFFRKNLKKIPQGIKISCIGPKTRQELENWGAKVYLMPAVFSSTGLAAAFKKHNLRGKKILLLRSDKGSQLLPKELSASGAKVSDCAVYRIAQARPKIKRFFKKLKAPVDIITFLSSESAKNFIRILGRKRARKILRQTKIASIGPETSATLKSLGFTVDFQPREFTVEALAQSITGN